MASGYYVEKLAGERLRACYGLAPPRVQAYLEAEIAFVLERVRASDRVLELGCGYGRVLGRLAPAARHAVGIDTSLSSLRLARTLLAGVPSVDLVVMDAARTGFRDGTFDLAACVQNGISAFGAEPARLLAEAARVTRPGGVVLFSSYSPRFWPHRLEWFEVQAAHGLVGPIDRAATGDGVIVCTDGFRATTMDAAGFVALAAGLGLTPRIVEVDGSSLFCEITAG